MPKPTYDWQYYNELALGKAQYDTTMAGIGLDRSHLSYDTGFGASGQVDLSNPYSQAMMLQRYKEQNSRGIQNSMAAQGQLYSRARKNAQSENSFQYERNRSDLQTQAQRGYQDLTLAQQQAGLDRSGSQYGSLAGQAGRWADAQHDWYELYGT